MINPSQTCANLKITSVDLANIQKKMMYTHNKSLRLPDSLQGPKQGTTTMQS